MGFLNTRTLLENLDHLITILLVEEPKLRFSRCLHTPDLVLFFRPLVGIYFVIILNPLALC